MTDEHRMEQLSRAYVQAVAAVSGFTCARPEPDYGVDLTLRRVGPVGGRFREFGKSLYLQLKSARADTRDSVNVVYDLEAGTYETLRRSTRDSPAILVLLLLPPDRGDWIDQNEERLEMRRCAYWLSLRGSPRVPNTSSVRVRIPRKNQFTPVELERIMNRIQRNEDLT